jgi:hypothetical protein
MCKVQSGLGGLDGQTKQISIANSVLCETKTGRSGIHCIILLYQERFRSTDADRIEVCTVRLSRDDQLQHVSKERGRTL